MFRGPRAKAVFAGMASHSFLSLKEPLTASFGIMLGASVHAVGWPIARGGSGAVTLALASYFESLGGEIVTARRVEKLADLHNANVTLCDVTPRQLLALAGDRLDEVYRRRMQRWQYGTAAFKVDYALNAPIPWTAKDCARSATVHIGGTLEEFVESEDAPPHGRHAERPFVLLAQPSLFDPSRAPDGKHTAWAYCHVPNGSTFDMLPRLEAQIERFAPGFRDCVLARRVFSPAALEAMDSNLIGGDIGGGAVNLRQFLFRPTGKSYATSSPNLYLCSSSTPPGGGVHGMCGYNAAKLALLRMSKT
jgi:phytoene dehydrogenase-like protein